MPIPIMWLRIKEKNSGMCANPVDTMSAALGLEFHLLSGPHKHQL